LTARLSDLRSHDIGTPVVIFDPDQEMAALRL
jgi:hypothetical protein